MENEKKTYGNTLENEVLNEDNFEERTTHNNLLEEEIETLDQRILNAMRMAFWDKLQDELKDKEYLSLLQLLEDIKERICDLVPNRPDIHQDLYEHIDTKFLQQMLEHDAVDDSYIYNLVQFIIDTLKNFDSIEDEPYYEIWRESINRRLVAPDYPNYVLLPIFFRETFHRLNKIEHSINMFKQSDIYKAIVEKREREKKLKENH